MPEKTIAAPLSGAEIKKAILDRVSQVLDADCFLHESAAYPSFSGKFTLELKLNDPIRGDADEIHAQETVRAGEPEGETQEIATDFEAEPPNQVRIKTGQGVPTEGGKKIRYARKTAEKASGRTA